MTDQISHKKNKGGRPQKVVKKDQLLGVKCSLVERKAIEARAKSVNLSISEYLRKMGLNGKIDRSEKVFPKEALQYSGTLNHIAANINQIAYKRNRNDELNAIERAKLMQDAVVVRQAALNIISYFK